MIKSKILFNDVITAGLNNEITWNHVSKAFKQLKTLNEKIKKVEGYSGLPYPPVRVSPKVEILIHEYDISGIVHARLNFIKTSNVIIPIVDLNLPFLLYADKELLTGVLAHEFLHYMFLAQKYVNSEYFSLSQYFGGTVIGRIVFDEVYQVPPEKIFSSKYVVNLLKSKLHKLLSKRGFTKKIVNNWIKKGYPHIKLPSEEFYIKMSIEEFKNLYFPEEILRVARQI